MESATPLATTHTAARVVLKPRKALPFYGRHPWVLASAVDRVEPTSIASEHLADFDGQVVDLLNDKGKFVARGIYNSQSRISVRLYTWSAEEAIDEEFFRRKLQVAIELRRQIGYEPGESRGESATRLCFSEADGISGLIVDRYGDCLVVQPTSLGVAQRLEMVVGLLRELLQPRAIVLRLDKATAQLEGMAAPKGQADPHPSPLPEGEGISARRRTIESAVPNVPFSDGHVWGELPSAPLVIREHGLAYEVDLHAGQKTGFYLDQ